MKRYISLLFMVSIEAQQTTIPFIGAVKLGSVKLVKHQLRSANCPINERDELGNSPLHYAANIDSYEITKLLLEHNAAVNARNNNGTTALHIATRHRNEKIVTILLRNGANPNLVDQEHNTPLHIAASYAHTQCGINIIQQLKLYGSQTTCLNKHEHTAHDIIHVQRSTHKKPLTVHEKNYQTTTQLLQQQDNPENNSLYTHVHKKYIQCAKTNNIEKMRRLLQHPCLNMNIQTGPKKRSALMYALRNRRTDMAQLLIDAGIDQSLCDADALTAQDYARMYSC